MVNIVDMFSLKDQVGIVTGGGQGPGKAFSLAFAEAGADIVVAELNSKTGPETVKEIENIGRRALFIETEVRQCLSAHAPRS